MIGRYILVLSLHYKYDGLHSCKSKECVGPEANPNRTTSTVHTVPYKKEAID